MTYLIVSTQKKLTEMYRKICFVVFEKLHNGKGLIQWCNILRMCVWPAVRGAWWWAQSYKETRSQSIFQGWRPKSLCPPIVLREFAPSKYRSKVVAPNWKYNAWKGNHAKQQWFLTLEIDLSVVSTRCVLMQESMKTELHSSLTLFSRQECEV